MATLVIVIVSVITGLVTLMAQILQCIPVSHFWERFSPDAKGSCYAPNMAYVILQTVNAFDIITDALLALLPCIMVWNMVMGSLKKCGVAVLLGVGSL